MKATLSRLGIRGFNPKLKKAAERLEDLRTPEGELIPPNTLAELRRDIERRRLVGDQIRQIEIARLERLKRVPNEGPHAMVRLLARVIGVGIETAVSSPYRKRPWHAQDHDRGPGAQVANCGAW